MSKMFFIVLVTLLPMSGFSQFVSLNELITLSSSNEDYFDTYATKKGYTFLQHEEDELANSVTYTFLKNGIKRGYLVKYSYNNKIGGWVELQTSDPSIFLKIKDALKVNNFTFYDKGVYKEATWMQYKRGDVSVKIFSSSEYNELLGSTSPHYSISVENKAF
jgi:hypothetical protein